MFVSWSYVVPLLLMFVGAPHQMAVPHEGQHTAAASAAAPSGIALYNCLAAAQGDGEVWTPQ